MSDAEYEAIAKAFPVWAKHVRNRVRETPPSDLEKAYKMGYLSGLSSAMILTGQCSRAYEFIRETEERERGDD